MICLLLKIIGGVLTALAGFGIGCMLTKKLSARRDFLGKFCVFISLLQTQIRYSSSDIFTLVKSCDGISNLNIFGGDADVPFVVFWETSIADIPVNHGLNNSDKELLLEFGSGLGTTDVEGQLRHIELYSEMFNKKLEDSKIRFKEKSRIYRALGIFAGASTALIFL